MKHKKLLSLLIVFAMFISMLPITSYAADGLIGNEKSVLSLVYLKYKDGYSSPAAGKTEELFEETDIPDTFTPGEEILIGIRLENLDQIAATTQGLFWLGTAVKYDTNYVSPKDLSTAAVIRSSKRLLGENNPDSLFYQGSDDAPLDTFYDYSTKDMEINQEVNGGTAVTVAVTYSDGEQPTYTGNPASKYVAVLRFTLNNVPPAGTRVFDFARDGSFETLLFGLDGKAAGYAYEDTLDEKKLENVMKYDVTGASIAPAIYSLTYDVNGGTYTGDSSDLTVSVKEDRNLNDLGLSLLDKSKITAPSGKVFSKWVIDNGDDTYSETDDIEVFKADTKFTQDTKVFAVYTDGYAVTMDANGGYFENTEDATDTSKTQVVLEKGLSDTVSDSEIPETSMLARDKYSLDTTKTWNTKANGTGTAYTDAAAVAAAVNANDPKASMDFYAQWTPNNPYDPDDPINPNNAMKVVFDTRTETAANPAEVQLYAGETLGGRMPDEPTKTDYKFAGWNTKANGSGKEVKSNTEITEAMADPATRIVTLYAQWEAQVNPVTVTFDKGDGDTDADPKTITVNSGDSISSLGANSMPTEPTKDGKGFIGWFDSTTGTTEFTETTPVTGDVTVYAQYGDTINVNIHSNMPFEAPATDDIIKTVQMAAGRKMAAADIPTAPTRQGYTFVEWRAAKSTAAADTAQAAAFDFTQDNITADTVEIYAIWTIEVDVEVKVPAEGNKEYTGEKIPAELVVKDSAGNELDVQPVAGTDYEVEYADVNDGSGTTIDTDGPTDQGTYTVDVIFNDGTTGIGVIYDYNPTDLPEYTIAPKKIKISLSDQKVTVKEEGDPAQPVAQKVTVGFGDPEPSPKPAEADYTVKYYSFTGTGTTIAADTEINEITEASLVGLYAVEIVFTNDNYVFDSFAEGTTYYTVTADSLADRHFATFEIEKAEVSVMFYTDDDSENPTVYTYVLPAGGNISAGATQDGTAVTTLPTEPTKANYKFVAWHIYKGTDADGDPKYDATRDDTTPFTADTIVDEDIKVVAEWKASDDAKLGEDEDGKMLVTFTAVEAADDGTETSTLPIENFFDSDYTTPKALDAEVTGDYYARVANKYNKIKVSATAAEPASVVEISVNGATAQTYVVTSEGLAGVGAATDETFDLAAATADAPTNDIAIKITAPDGQATETYTFKIQRLNVGSITLNYGNSPYGMIMKEAGWTDEQKATAKESFVTRGGRFDTTLVPTGGNATRYYRNHAWGGSMDAETNLDMDDHVIFVYNRTNFRDPGFEAYDSVGNKVADTEVTRTITVSRMQASGTNGLSDANQADDTVTVTGQANDYLFTEITAISTATKAIRPDIYEMKYSFTDPVSNETVEVVRKVVVLGKLGDCDMSNIVNSSDMNAIKGAIGGSALASNTDKTSVKNLYIYRMVDTDRSGVVNASDMNAIKGAVGGTAIAPIYEPLPAE